MKLSGREFTKPYTITVVIPRDEGPIAFIARAVLDYSNFEKLCPHPVAPFITRPNEPSAQNVEDVNYKLQVAEYHKRRINWMIIESLKATPELTWDKVKADDPTTWNLYEQELKDSHFSTPEINRIIQAVWRANCLDEGHLERARKDFLAMAVQPKTS